MKSIIPPVSGENLMNIAYDMLGGDMLASVSVRHRGSPAVVDNNGVSKSEIWEAASSGDTGYFIKMAATLNTKNEWIESMVSRRRFQKKTDGGIRKIDIPPEILRLYATWVEIHLLKHVRDMNFYAPYVIGFRSVNEFVEFKKRGDSPAIQDVFAAGVYQLIRDCGPWVVSLDLKDAFGELPHKAIHAALEQLGIKRAERRRILQLVRIRARLSNGHKVRKNGKGISQGNPLSPLIYNIVQSHVSRLMINKGFTCAAYGDDIVIVASTRRQAEQAFDLYWKISDELGFENLRGLDHPEKPTVIQNTDVSPVTLIKTYQVGGGMIRLTHEKMEQLLKPLGSNPSLRQVIKTCPYKVVSKQYFREILASHSYTHPSGGDSWGISGQPGLDSPRLYGSLGPVDVSPRPICIPLSGYHVRAGGLTHEFLSLGVYRLWTIGADSPLPIAPFPRFWVYTQTTGQTGHRETGHLNGRNVTSRERSVAGQQPGQEAVGSIRRPAASLTVKKLDADVISTLKNGQRLKLGDRYRGFILDLRNLNLHVADWRLPNAIRQLCRVASVSGCVQVLVHPSERWLWNEKNWEGFRITKRVYDPMGQIWVVRKVVRQPQRKKQPAFTFESVDLWIDRIKCSKFNSRLWHTRFRYSGREQRLEMTTKSLNSSLAKAEIIAMLVENYTPETVAIPKLGILENNLTVENHIHQVSLAYAIGVLRGWRWTVDGDYLVGRRVASPQNEAA